MIAFATLWGLARPLLGRIHWQTWALLGAIAGLVIAYAIITHRAYERGAADTLTTIHRQNEEAHHAADTARDKAQRDFDAGRRGRLRDPDCRDC